MTMKTKLTRLILLLALIVLPTGMVHAQDKPGGDTILFGEDYTLPEGETHNGNIAVFGGNVEIQKEADVEGSIAVFGGNISIAKDSVINGDIAVFGANLSINGTVNGDIVVFGGQVLLASTASVDGDIATFGGQVSREPGAKVSGQVTNNQPPSINTPNNPETPNIPAPTIQVNTNPFFNFIWAIFRAFAFAGIGMLVALFLQPQLERTGNAIIHQPLVAGGFGLLTVLAVPIAIVILSITLILIPVAAIVALIAGLGWLFGVIALGQEVGYRFTKAINQTWAPIFITGFGTLFLMLIVELIGLIPCVGWIPSFLVTLVGLGAVAMTWFGTRNPPGMLPAPIVTEEAASAP